MSLDHIRNMVRSEASRMQAGRSPVRIGTVAGYDPSHFAVKVTLQPDGTLTGWLPLTSPWVGNGWGIFAAPNIGDQVEVQFQEDGAGAGFVVGRFYTNANPPQSVPTGEFWVVHSTGSALKFNNDGSVQINSTGNLTAVVGGNLSATVSGTSAINSTGAMTLESSGTLTLQGSQINLVGPMSQSAAGGGASTASFTGSITATGNVTAGSIDLKTHVHTGVQTGSGTTGGPTG